MQWSQLAILFGLMGLYLIYLPRARPGGFNIAWRAMICFLNYGAITLILSTFTSRFVYPMISLEGRQMWLVGLWPMSRNRVMWAKFLFAYSVTAAAALAVTALSIRSLGLPAGLGLIQAFGTLATCAGLCGLAVGLGARLPNYRESSPGRIASGLGGTINLIASVSLVTVNVALFGVISYRQAGAGSLANVDAIGIDLFVLIVLIGVGTGAAAMRIGCRSFRRQEF
jgi:ABC-2 type transport system permease protein